MVTQLYTAPIKPFVPGTQFAPGAPVATRKKPGEAGITDDEKQKGNSQTLEALREQASTGGISIHSILTDFQNTMEALGATPEVKSEVAPYLQVVAHQAQRNQPSAGLIKNNLKAAADTLDQFITGTLGQESHVVKEWVEALLLQPVNYRSDQPIQVGASPGGFQPFKTETAAPQSVASNSILADIPKPGVTKADQDSIKRLLQQAKTESQSGDFKSALVTYQNVLDTVTDADAPELKGRVLYQMGKVLVRSGNREDAKALFQQAHEALAGSYHPKLQSRIHKALGSSLQHEGRLDEAKQHYLQSLAMDDSIGDKSAQSVTLNQLGMISLTQGSLDEAKATLNEALDQAAKHNPKILGDVLSNLGAISRREGRLSQAFQYYKQSLTESVKQSNGEGARQTLQNIASLYLEAGKPDKALKALQRSLS